MKKAKRLPETLTEEERERLLQAPNKRTPTGLRNLCVMLLMLDAGLRVSEVLNLKVSHINWNTGKLTVKEGKGRKDRILWMDEEDLKILAKWREKRWVQTEHIFTTLRGKQLSDRYIREMIKREGKAAGIEKDVHPHMLRHTFATDIYRDTKNIRLTQRVLGHSNLATTMIYTHIVDDEVESAMRCFRRKGGVVLGEAS